MPQCDLTIVQMDSLCVILCVVPLLLQIQSLTLQAVGTFGDVWRTGINDYRIGPIRRAIRSRTSHFVHGDMNVRYSYTRIVRRRRLRLVRGWRIRRLTGQLLYDNGMLGQRRN